MIGRGRALAVHAWKALETVLLERGSVLMLGRLAVSEDPMARVRACRALAGLGARAAAALDSVRRAMEGTQDEGTILAALHALEVLGAEGRPAVPEVLRLFHGERAPSTPAVTRAAVNALIAIGGERLPVTPELRRVLEGGPLDRASEAVRLVTGGCSTLDRVQALFIGLAHPEREVRQRCLHALGRIGSRADLAELERFARSRPDGSACQLDACAAIQAIRVRLGEVPSSSARVLQLHPGARPRPRRRRAAL